MVAIAVHKRPPRGLVPRLRRALSALMEELGVADKAVTVILTGDRRLRALKRVWWGEDQATDVLAFPQYEPGDPFVPPHLGDIWISLDAAAEQARTRGVTLEEEVLALAAHGLWHLLGHDHEGEGDWQGFHRVQERILAL
ncbi:rRNA maturation RNase YbeY [Thermus thermamylovorans]|uniref:Endoribonuclease YbeY n=1 Tax=Thermus thermamylovorans TaxID=2509362 RepID=A0A4Q9B892_9DEIN|nr:rRNA maturation RNase YbeY [Thermus thermamylovorans]TBH21846.1 rRNA maturation RNase YbeY [Thermus thermamylovorans]